MENHELKTALHSCLQSLFDIARRQKGTPEQKATLETYNTVNALIRGLE